MLRAKDIREILIGLMTVLVFAAVIIFMNRSGRVTADNNDATYSVNAQFNQIDGLDVGAVVRMSGIAIGRVISEKLDDQHRAIVMMKIDKDIPLPLDTSASIQTDGLFGAKYIGLEPGGAEDFIKDGDNLIYTQDALVVTDLLELIISEGRSKQKP